MVGIMDFIDLFSGAGGLSEGFITAGYTPVAHIEMDIKACETMETRTVYHYLKSISRLDIYDSYLKKEIDRKELLSYIDDTLISTIINDTISIETIDIIFDKIDKIIIAKGIKEIPIVIGGPPCQAYSLVGRSRDPDKMRNDPRNTLYKMYIKFLERYKPKVFVFENVLGILSAQKGSVYKNLVKEMKEIGYNLDYRKLDSSDYGILQKRIRVIIVGWREDLNYVYPELEKIKHNYIVKDVLSDLPLLQAGESVDVGEYRTSASEYLSEFQLRSDTDILTQHLARPHNNNDKGIYKIAIDKWYKQGERLKYSDLGDDFKTHKNVKSFLDRYKIVADDLQYTQTIVAHIAKDGHYYIHPDKMQCRSLTIREAARIQSFPDNFYFEGKRTAAFKQIGNAVPPLLANRIALKLKEYLE